MGWKYWLGRALPWPWSGVPVWSEEYIEIICVLMADF